VQHPVILATSLLEPILILFPPRRLTREISKAVENLGRSEQGKEAPWREKNGKTPYALFARKSLQILHRTNVRREQKTHTKNTAQK